VDAYPALKQVVLTVPARMELWSNYDRYYGHFVRYDKARMRAHAAECGLDVADLRYVFNGLYPVMLALTRRDGDRSLETRPPTSALAVRLHALAGAAFTLEARLPLVGLLPGTSLFAVLSTNSLTAR
jgi:hypothetical protein